MCCSGHNVTDQCFYLLWKPRLHSVKQKKKKTALSANTDQTVPQTPLAAFMCGKPVRDRGSAGWGIWMCVCVCGNCRPSDFNSRVGKKKKRKPRQELTMFTSEMESMLAMLMLIPTMTGGPEDTKENLVSLQKYKNWSHTTVCVYIIHI